MIAVVVVSVIVVKELVWDAAIINMVVVIEMLVINVLVGVDIIMVGVIAIVLKFALSVSSYFVDVPLDVVVDFFMDAFVGVMLSVLSGNGIKVLADSSTNAFAVMPDLKFFVSTPLEEFTR